MCQDQGKALGEEGGNSATLGAVGRHISHAFPVLNEALGIGLGEAEAALVLFVAEHAELEAAQAIVLHLFFDVTLEFESGLGCLRQVASEQQTTAVTCVQEEARRVVYCQDILNK